MLCGSGELDRLTGTFARFGEPAQLSKADDEPGASVDRSRGNHAESLVGPFGRQYSQCLACELDDSPVLTSVIVRLLEIAGSGNQQLQVSHVPRKLQSMCTSRHCFI